MTEQKKNITERKWSEIVLLKNEVKSWESRNY